MVDNTRARRLDNLSNAKLLIKSGVYVFVSSGKTPLIPKFNKIDTELTQDEREAAIEKYEADHGEPPIHVGATVDPAAVSKMFKRYPDAVPSIACGPSKLVVVDADQKDNGPELIGKHFEEHGLPDGAVIVPSQSGGRHYIFKDPEGKYTNAAGALKKQYGCDLRGKGGQYVAPGSMREDGKTYGTKKNLYAFLNAYVHNTLPELPDHVAALIGTAGEASQSVDDKQLAAVIKELEDTDWPDHVDLFEPVIGTYDLEALKQSNDEFAELYANPSSDCSDNRWKIAQHVMRDTKMPVTHLAVLFEGWEGAGTQTEDGKGSGNYNLRDIAREWIKNKDRYVSTGEAFGAVVDIDEEDEEERAAEEYSKKIEAERKEERDEAKAELRGEMYYANDLARYTRADYIVENMCAPGQLGVLYGASNVGKTFAVIHLGDCVAEGAPWFGRQTEKAGVLYLFAEGKDQFNNRLAAYRTKYPSEGKGMLVHKGIPPINTPAGLKAFRRAIADANKWQEENELPPVRLAFIDTFAKAVAGADENSAKEMQPILNDLRKVAEKMGICIIIVHHTGKDTTAGSRGSYAIFADADFELELFDHVTAKKKKLKVVMTPSQIAIFSDKLRDGPKGGMVMFRLEEVTLGKNKWGRPATSVVAVPDVPSDGSAMGAVVDDDEAPGTTDKLAGEQNRKDDESRLKLCAKVIKATIEIGRSVGMERHADAEKVRAKIKPLQDIFDECGASNFSRRVRKELFGSEELPKRIVPEMKGELWYVGTRGKAPLFMFKPSGA